MLQNNNTLKSLIDKLWQNFWEGGIANPLTAIEQITYLLFMKRLDDLEAKRERDAEFTGEKYTSRFKGKFTVPGSKDSINKNELRWSVFNRTSPYTISSNDITRLVFQGNVGLVFKINGVQLEYFQSYLTKEFETGGSHLWGGIRVGWYLRK